MPRPLQTISERRPSPTKSAVAVFERVKSLPASAVILDASGTIVAVNDAWKEFGRRNRLRVPHFAIGSNYLKYCRSDEPHSRRFVRELKALLAGRRDLLTFIYPCHSPSQERWFSLIGLPLSVDEPAGVALLHVNLTDMLPLAIDRRPTRAKSERRQKFRPATDLDAISGAVERSVSETLSSQLNTMFTRPRQREEDAAHEEADELVLARTRLSRRQMEVLHLLGKGKTNKEIARMLFLSPNTIKLHVSAILQRLKLRSRTHAALLSSRLSKHGSSDSAEGNLTSWKRTHAPARQGRRNTQSVRGLLK
jgi:DNA-binding CsgD family transcriptional regulator